MSFIRGGETITIKRRSEAGVDDYGNQTYTTTTVTVKQALIAFGGSAEPIDAEREALDAKITAYLPSGTVIEEGDVFIIRNSSWVKDGNPLSWTNPFTSFESGVVVQLRKRNG